MGTIKAFTFVFILGVGLTGCHKKPAAATQGPLPVNVVVAVEKEVVEWDTFTGRMEAAESVDIRPRVTGYIQELKFTPGTNTLVKKNDLLFIIDPRPYQAEMDRAAGELERAQAGLQLGELDFKRATDLRAKNTISTSEYDQKVAAQKQAQAAVGVARAAYAAAKLNLEFTEIRSPIDGRISDERVKAGNLVQPGAGPESILTTVVSVDPIQVYVDIDENRVLKYIKLDEEGKRPTGRRVPIPAYVSLGNETDFPHVGVVDFIDNRLDPNTGTLRARATFKSWNPFLTPGLFVRCRISGGPSGKAVLIDDKVVSSDQGQKYVFVVRPDGTVERRNIQIGSVVDGQRVVHAGLKDGEQVVASRLMMLQPGMKVQPIVAAK
ncbi:MAG: efflux RND transporter periplasmic adaptor subunit [Chthoniobacter sp.]